MVVLFSTYPFHFPSEEQIPAIVGLCASDPKLCISLRASGKQQIGGKPQSYKEMREGKNLIPVSKYTIEYHELEEIPFLYFLVWTNQ